MQTSSPGWGVQFKETGTCPDNVSPLFTSRWGVMRHNTSLTESVKCGFAACYCRPNASHKRDKRGSGGRGQTGWLDSDRHLSCSFVSFCPVSTPSPGSTWRAPGQFTSPGLTGNKGRGAQFKSCRHFDSSLMMALSRYLFRRPCAECRKQHSFHMEPFPHLSHFSCYFSL